MSIPGLTFEELACLKGDGPVNIFMLDHDPVKAARWHADRHVVKMILETAQLLSTVWHQVANEEWQPLAADPADDPAEPSTPWIRRVVAPPRLVVNPEPVAVGEMPGTHWELFGQRIYAPTHVNHPCAVWARETGGNYSWLWRLGIALCEEYRHRYKRHHNTSPVLWTLEPVPPPLLESLDTWTEVPPAMPEEVKVVEDGFYNTVASYRAYYAQHKVALHSWTRREAPPWLEEFTQCSTS